MIDGIGLGIDGSVQRPARALVGAGFYSDAAVMDHVCDRIASQISPGDRVVTAALLEAPIFGSSKELVVAAETLMLSTLPKRVDEAFLSARLKVDRRALRRAFLHVRGQSVYRAMLILRLLTARRTLERHPTLSP